MRKKRSYEATCNCARYPFPHRMFGGKCNGLAFVANHFENHRFGSCLHCVLNSGDCEVLEGREAVKECPEMQAHVEFEGLRLPVKWRPRAGGFSVHRVAA